jgi:hypothetical protein
MTDTNTATQDLQEQVLDTVRKGQDTLVEAVKAWADAVHQITPSNPDLPKYVEALPRPDTLVAEGYDFAANILANQREFAENLLKAVEPVLARKA